MTEARKAAQELSNQILVQAERYEDAHPHKPLAYAMADIAAQVNTPANIGLTALLKERPMTTDHIAPIVFATAQYVDTKAGVSRNFGAMTKEEWTKYLSNLFQANDPDTMKTLRERNVQSFIMRRYFPAKMFARMIYGDKPLSVLDVGCSLNLGLQAIGADQQGELFPGLHIENITQEVYSGRVNISNGLGVDLHEPDIDWITSCIWPDHESEKELIRKAHEKLSGKNPNIKFRKISALELELYPELAGQFDLIIASGMLYQLSLNEEKQFFRQIEKVAKSDAWLLTTDYPRGVSYKQSFSYTTYVQHICDDQISNQFEFVKADDPFTTVIKTGKDFSVIKGRKVIK